MSTLSLAQYPSVAVSTVVDAAPDAVWRIVADINAPAGFSSEFRGAQWVDAAPHGVGSVFEGHNGRGEREWSTRCTVVAWVPNTLFTYIVDRVEEPLAIWSLQLHAEGQRTRLTMTATAGLGVSGLSRAVDDDPEHADAIIAGRLATWQTNMRATIEGFKQLAELSG
jgi:hypothetical protein